MNTAAVDSIGCMYFPISISQINMAVMTPFEREATLAPLLAQVCETIAKQVCVCEHMQILFECSS
jgi:hypothetical protein